MFAVSRLSSSYADASPPALSEGGFVEYVIFKDGKQFLIVNASPHHAADVLESFRRQSGRSRFRMERRGE